MTLISNLQTWWQSRHPGTLIDWTDHDLLRLFGESGSTAAMNTLIQRHCHALYHYLLTLSDATLAEDISQQVWTQIIEQPQRYQAHQAQFRSWLFTVGRNRTIDELRRLQRWQWQSLDDSDVESTEIDWQENPTFEDSAALSDAFDTALTSLPFPQKEAVTLQLEGFSLSEIASITGDKPETIKSRLRFARQHLKSRLEENHV